ncbi:phage baseplate protein [Enterococcus xiangfangensis]|uniref:phage baseplate protein n=1 Tax=Enterococcus xiangfangensis TaxID=1296537 RepID=UPI003D1690C2|nr:hypothetical protein [Enterococcus asini]
MISDLTYPTGSIYTSVVSTSPATLFGGIWERFAKGQTLVGVNESDADFFAGKSGGEKKHRLTLDEMPSHQHPTTSDGEQMLYTQAGGTNGTTTSGIKTYVGASETLKTGSVGNDTEHNNLQPYITVLSHHLK